MDGCNTYRTGAIPALVCVFALICAAAHADREKVHGFELDDKHGLRIHELDGWATIQLRIKDRPTFGPNEYIDDESGDLVHAARFQIEDDLVRLRSEPLMPAPPNYLKNPAVQYRITIEGMSVAPEYKRIFIVDAADALDAIFFEMTNIMEETYGIRRYAVLFGTFVATYVLNESQRLPARLPLTVLRSAVALYRIQGQGLGRTEVGQIQRYDPVAQGQRFRMVMRAHMKRAQTNPSTALMEKHIESHVLSMQREASPRLKRYEERYQLEQRDYRTERVAEFDAPELKRRDELGRPGEPLTEPEIPLPPVEMSVRENLELRYGSLETDVQREASGGRRNERRGAAVRRDY